MYLEYGFKHLKHQEVVYRSLLFKVDIYEMKDSVAAYGIFSISSLRCQKEKDLSVINCITPRQIQFAAGRFYVSISNIRGDTNAQSGGIELAKRLLKKNVFTPYTPPPIFHSGLIADYQSDIKVIAGPLGLQNGYPDWSDWFEGCSSYFITMLENRDDNGTFLLSRIEFTQPEDLNRFIKEAQLKEKVNTYYWKQLVGDRVKLLIKLDEFTCLFVETNKKHQIRDALISSFDKVGQKAGENKD